METFCVNRSFWSVGNFMSMSILLMTENQYNTLLFSHIARNESIEIINTSNRDQVKAEIASSNFIAVVLDFPNPTIDDFEYWQELLQLTSKPILLLSSDIHSAERVLLRQKASFGLGKPLLNLFLNLNSIQNQEELSNSIGTTFELASGIVFDPFGHCVIKNGESISLSRSEFKIIHALIQNRGQFILADELVTLADLAGISSLYIHVKTLREKIEKDPYNPSVLINKRGYGYVLNTLA